MLPRVNGFEICRAIRARGDDMPILMLTAKGQEEDVILGLNLGADDYIAKPFRIGELMARVQRTAAEKYRPPRDDVPVWRVRAESKRPQAVQGRRRDRAHGEGVQRCSNSSRRGPAAR